MKLVVRILAALVVIIILITVVGLVLPKAHTASVRAVISAPPESIYAAITDVERGTAWRTGLKQVEVLDRDPLLWRETAEWGTITFVRADAVAPQRVVTRIADESEGFGGTWSYEIAPAPEQKGSTVTITEHGTVSNPLFRVLSKFVFGHYTSLETYARDLGKRFGHVAEPQRVN